jgi:UDP-N-acetylglucosamine--N-acetylmuramyl-(pentapeptide) pyrophosphoryl-undecaprenol N-acetylglucosamine transferase
VGRGGTRTPDSGQGNPAAGGPRGAMAPPPHGPAGSWRSRASGQVVAVFSGGGTGGHLYPALALADALTGLRPDVQPFFVGAERGLEARILPEKGLDHLLLPVRGFERGAMRGGGGVLGGVLEASLRALGVLDGLARSLAATGEAFSRLRPSLVVVTGGYAGGPAGLMAGLMGIPLALQEQNAWPGVTTRILSRWSRQVHLAFPEAVEALPRGARSRATVSGNPIRVPSPGDITGGAPRPAEGNVPGRAATTAAGQTAGEGAGRAVTGIAAQAAADRSYFGLDPASRVVLVVGGSQGAAAVNGAVLEAVRGVAEGALHGPEDLQLLWATGRRNQEEVEGELERLGSPAWVRAMGYIHDMPRALRCATLAVSRAGAMATSEFLAWGVPSILVPLPTAAADHQARNAESLARAGAAVHLPEAELSGARLWAAVTTIMGKPEDLEAMQKASLERGRPEAARQIAEALAALLPRPANVPGGGAA